MSPPTRRTGPRQEGPSSVETTGKQYDPPSVPPGTDTSGRLRRDRTGELVLVEDYERHYCRRGWTGEDSEGRPIPCHRCRPHLRPMLAKQRAWDGRP